MISVIVVSIVVVAVIEEINGARVTTIRLAIKISVQRVVSPRAGIISIAHPVLVGVQSNILTVEQKAIVAEAVEHNLWPLFEKGDIKPLIYKTFPLKDADKAHALMASSSHIGKIMLTVDDAA